MRLEFDDPASRPGTAGGPLMNKSSSPPQTTIVYEDPGSVQRPSMPTKTARPVYEDPADDEPLPQREVSPIERYAFSSPGQKEEEVRQYQHKQRKAAAAIGSSNAATGRRPSTASKVSKRLPFEPVDVAAANSVVELRLKALSMLSSQERSDFMSGSMKLWTVHNSGFHRKEVDNDDDLAELRKERGRDLGGLEAVWTADGDTAEHDGQSAVGSDHSSFLTKEERKKAARARLHLDSEEDDINVPVGNVQKASSSAATGGGLKALPRKPQQPVSSVDDDYNTHRRTAASRKAVPRTNSMTTGNDPFLSELDVKYPTGFKEGSPSRYQSQSEVVYPAEEAVSTTRKKLMDDVYGQRDGFLERQQEPAQREGTGSYKAPKRPSSTDLYHDPIAQQRPYDASLKAQPVPDYSAAAYTRPDLPTAAVPPGAQPFPLRSATSPPRRTVSPYEPSPVGTAAPSPLPTEQPQQYAYHGPPLPAATAAPLQSPAAPSGAFPHALRSTVANASRSPNVGSFVPPAHPQHDSIPRYRDMDTPDNSPSRPLERKETQSFAEKPSNRSTSSAAPDYSSYNQRYQQATSGAASHFSTGNESRLSAQSKSPSISKSVVLVNDSLTGSSVYVPFNPNRPPSLWAFRRQCAQQLRGTAEENIHLSIVRHIPNPPPGAPAVSSGGMLDSDAAVVQFAEEMRVAQMNNAALLPFLRVTSR